jgi:RecA-family ATPase
MSGEYAYLNTDGTDKSPFELLSIDQLPTQMPPLVIEGLLRQLEIILIGGHSKSWKSWALLDLLYCVANGLPWLGSETIQGEVVHFDLELLSADIRYRFEAIKESHGKGSFDNLKIVSLRGKPFDLLDLKQLPKLLGDDVSLLSLDPNYRLLAGQNESDPGVVIDLMNRFLSLGTNLKSAVGLLQHFSKGDHHRKAQSTASAVQACGPDTQTL